jgi:phosphate transport system permease protein
LSIIAIIPLLSILATVFINGVSAINLEFLTSLPAPFGESGGGIGNAILGTLIINSMACLFGIPLGIFTGMYLSEYGQKSRLGTAVRLVVESLSGVP